MPSNPAIRLNGLEKTYRTGFLRRPVVALTGLDLSVEPGEIYGLIGPNGAGKTTTFRILLGLMRADSGTGEILGLRPGHPEARRQLGFLPESPSYYPYLTVSELLRLAARLSGVSEIGIAVERVLERFDLTRMADRPLKKLSKGQLQRVGVAQAAVHDPRLFILDEPMSGLDPVNRSKIKSWIRSMRAEGRTVVMASHVLADVEALADKVGILSGGRITAEGTAEELLEGSEEEVEVEFLLNEDPSPLLDGISACLERRAGLWAATCATGCEVQVSGLLRRILSHGGTVRSVRRGRQSLETYYMRSMQEEPERQRIAQEGR